MITCDYRISLDLSDAGHQPLGQFPIEPDFIPARSCLAFAALRASGVPLASGISAIVEPEWTGRGAPHVEALHIALAGHALRLDLKFFRAPALAISSRLVAEGRLSEGAEFHYRPLAFRKAAEPRRRILIESDEDDPLAVVRARSLESLFARAELRDVEHAGAEDLPVFIPAAVLAELEVQTRAAGSMETGGILIGHLLRDPDCGALALEITAFISAEHTLAKSVSLTFTPETWGAVQAAIELRRSSERAVGWAHSHPVHAWDLCAKCPPEKRAVCSLRKPFLSGDDLNLHRCVFPTAFNVALLASHDSTVAFACFGWRSGVVQRRAFHVLQSANPPSHA